MLFTTMHDHLILTNENALAFERSIHFLQQTLTELRRISFGLMPALVHTHGLDEALRRECAAASGGTVNVQYRSSGLDGISTEKAISVYRIVQELLANVKPEARTVKVEVELAGETLKLLVQDDGSGMPMPFTTAAGGSGLRNIQQQVGLLKGNMHVDSEKGKGTTVQISLQV